MPDAHCLRAGLWIGILACSVAPAANLMPVPQQNDLVRKYCAVCHTDGSKNGGLSLEHFSAEHAEPSLIAMMLSKITGGASLETAREAGVDEKATAAVARSMKSGAMGAAGIPIPDKATIDALIHAFAMESVGATNWSVLSVNAPELTASMLRESPSGIGSEGGSRLYRLIVSCDRATHEGSISLAWSPLPRSGTLAVSVDGAAPVSFPVAGAEQMGNGSGVVTKGLAAITLAGLPMAAKSLTLSDLVPEDIVEFPFEYLRQYRDFEACFPK